MRILVIGDVHLPFEVDGYLDHCKEVYAKHKCDTVIFIGDIIDMHYSSFHQPDPDGMGGYDELRTAVNKVTGWYEAFPKATIMIGNHDAIIARKAKMANVPSLWIKDWNKVLKTPKWKWKTEHIADGVLYQHGLGGTAKTLVKNYGMSTVGGHRHSEMYCEYFTTPKGTNFAMQVGCGVDRDSYAMNYARAYKAQQLGCGVVIDGKAAYLEPMV